MAVIIPTAKMPNNCEECDLKALCPDYWTKTREEYTRPSWCQLDDLDATTFCGVPMKEAVEIMQMYRRGELVHFRDYAIKTDETDNAELKREVEKYLQGIMDKDEPTIDAVSVVRCKECKYYDKFPTWSACTYWSGDPYEQASVNADDFCSYGEREDE